MKISRRIAFGLSLLIIGLSFFSCSEDLGEVEIQEDLSSIDADGDRKITPK